MVVRSIYANVELPKAGLPSAEDKRGMIVAAALQLPRESWHFERRETSEEGTGTREFLPDAEIEGWLDANMRACARDGACSNFRVYDPPDSAVYHVDVELASDEGREEWDLQFVNPESGGPVPPGTEVVAAGSSKLQLAAVFVGVVVLVGGVAYMVMRRK